MPPLPLLERLAALKDPRQAGKVLYPLPEIILLALSATLSGADDFVETVLWGEEHTDFLRGFYPYAKGIRHYACYADIGITVTLPAIRHV
jgi:hypothetical protein